MLMSLLPVSASAAIHTYFPEHKVFSSCFNSERIVSWNTRSAASVHSGLVWITRLNRFNLNEFGEPAEQVRRACWTVWAGYVPPVRSTGAR